ncbi:hypothetical protein ACFY0F_25955 [Streptomyces sp. NPDC001544]|uniref:hypothetical protein n=1 Tax=Streptomyces sp. NPDC001544 TaxID=3364584 RepID=UPI0036C7D466
MSCASRFPPHSPDGSRPPAKAATSLAARDRIRDVLLTPAGFTGLTLTQAQVYGAWGHGAEDAAAFLLGTGPGRHLMEQVDATARDRARRALTDHLREHEAEDGTVRLLSTSWPVTAVRPRV